MTTNSPFSMEISSTFLAAEMAQHSVTSLRQAPTRGTFVEEKKASDEHEIVAEEDSKKEKRTQCKLSRRAWEEENDQEYKEMF